MRTKNRKLRCESLEDRQLLACPALPASYVTAFDKIPIFADADRVCTVKSGLWSDPSIWSGGAVPTVADDVQVLHRVKISGDAAADDIVIDTGGRLTFSTGAGSDCNLLAGSIEVLSGGQLVAGSVGSPMLGHVEIVIRDRPLDPVGDPRQFGNGVLVLGGSVITYGEPLGHPIIRLSGEALAGEAVLALAQTPSSWPVGGRVVVAGSNRGLAGGGTEVRTVTATAADGRSLSLDRPLSLDHLGARDVNGNLDYLPHVASLTRSVVFRSENPNGVRGHFLATGTSYVNVRWTEFEAMGRTLVRALDNSRFDSAGTLTHFGTNQIGRYSLHAHHLQGPANPARDLTRTQFYLIGNSVDNDSKWGVTIHDSHYGVIDRHVLYKTPGAGIVTEQGNEWGNRFTDNFSAVASGSGQGPDVREQGRTDFAHEGANYWWRGVGGSTFAGNIGVGAKFTGQQLYTFSAGMSCGSPCDWQYFPAFPGADLTKPAERIGRYVRETPPAFMGDLEMYGQPRAYEWWQPPHALVNFVQQPFVTQRLVAWRVGEGSMQLYGGNIIFQEFVVRGDWLLNGSTGLTGMPHKITLDRADIQGMSVGLNHSSGANDVIRDSIFATGLGIYSRPVTNQQPSTTTVARTRFLVVPGLPLRSIVRTWFASDYSDATLLDRMVVDDYQGIPGDDFAVYFPQQAPDFIMPKTGVLPGFIGSPESGLTNAQNKVKYGIAIGGQIAPCLDDVTHAEILGYVCQ